MKVNLQSFYINAITFQNLKADAPHSQRYSRRQVSVSFLVSNEIVQHQNQVRLGNDNSFVNNISHQFSLQTTSLSFSSFLFLYQPGNLAWPTLRFVIIYSIPSYTSCLLNDQIFRSSDSIREVFSLHSELSTVRL